ncbi:hypothetical protein [Spiroplasma melliferum]|uniref:hypothetical protein n=1 Tax=Spiroplasma melliferum TaxID=2134 RepID=UPI0002A6492C|nr:hypothetical protein [Spiroplasma melliferum]ELL44852.1 hypothetical protein SMIPMB4A_v3c1810 [Spiroplasma melliferum IPMB4A]
MKKLFTYLMALGIMSISATTIVSCGCSYPKQHKLEEEKEKKDSDVNSSLLTNDNIKKEEKTLQFPIDISGITKIKAIKKVNVKNIKDVQFSEWSEPIRDAILETLHEELSTKLTKADYDVTLIIPKEFYIKDNLIDTLPFDLTIPRKIEITCLGKNNTKGSFNTYVILPKGTVK